MTMSVCINACTYESPGLTCITAAIVKSILSNRTNGSTGTSAGVNVCIYESPGLTCITAAIVKSILSSHITGRASTNAGITVCSTQRCLHFPVSPVTTIVASIMIVHTNDSASKSMCGSSTATRPVCVADAPTRAVSRTPLR